MDMINKEKANLLAECADFKTYLEKMHAIYAPGDFLQDYIKFNNIKFDPIIDMMEKLYSGHMAYLSVYVERCRATYTTSFQNAVAIHQALYRINKKTTLFVCDSKGNLKMEANRFLESIDAIKRRTGFKISYNFKESKDQIKINIYSIINEPSEIIFMVYKPNEPIKMDCFLRSLNVDLLIPYNVPYTKGYKTIRETLTPILYKNKGLELIIGVGGNLQNTKVQEFVRIKESIMDYYYAGIGDTSLYLSQNAIELEMPEEWIRQQKIMLSYDLDDSSFRREVLCETF